jgi:site-specific DNA-cytosine methylase
MVMTRTRSNQEYRDEAEVLVLPDHAQALQTDGCLRTGTSFGTDNPQSSRTIRRLTPIECERLQGFPDNWTKYGLFENGTVKEISDTQRYKCCGNAVSTPVIKAVWLKLILEK